MNHCDVATNTKLVVIMPLKEWYSVQCLRYPLSTNWLQDLKAGVIIRMVYGMLEVPQSD